eukprot:gene251-870_t
MPLIIMCGFPCSGKSLRAAQLKEYFEKEKGKKVVLIDEHSIGGVHKDDVYSSSIKEKSTRASYKAAVERVISRDDIVILDSLNYIKGYRYELHCVVKSHKTLHCLVQSAVHQDKCIEWNSNRKATNKYSDKVCRELLMRFEPPDSRNRWDSPLFTAFPEDNLPFEDIFDALFGRKAPPPNQSTMNTPLSSTNFLYELDRITQEIIAEILENQKMAVIGERLHVSSSEEKINLIKIFNMAELRRMKRQFLTYTKMHPIEDTRKIGNMFVQYINNSAR